MVTVVSSVATVGSSIVTVISPVADVGSSVATLGSSRSVATVVRSCNFKLDFTS